MIETARNIAETVNHGARLDWLIHCPPKMLSMTRTKPIKEHSSTLPGRT